MTNKQLKKELTKIAKEAFVGVETLEYQNRDSLDFHEVSVGSIEWALEQAYKLGLETARKEANK